MICPNCGNFLLEDSKFCGSCGARMMTGSPTPGKKRSGRTVKIIAVGAAVLILLAAVLGGFLLFGERTDPWQEQYDRGVRCLSDGDYEEAAEAFLAAIDIDPDRPEAYKRAARAYVKLDDYESARDILQEGIDETDDDDLIDELEDLEEDMGGKTGDDTSSGSLWEEDVPTEPEAMVTVYLPTRMEKTIYGDTNTVWVEIYAYDSLGNRVERTQYKPDGSLNFTEYMEYDAEGRLIRRTYQGGSYTSVYNYVYDSLGRQIEVSYNDEVYSYTLDDQGRLSRYQDDDSEYSVYVYGEDGWSHVRYVYKADGTMTEYTQVYCDHRGNITSTWRYTAEGSLLYRTDYIFDEGNNHVQTLCYGFCSADHVGTTYTYTYDEYDNLIRVDYNGDYYSSDSTTIYTVEPVSVTESAAARLGQ